MSLISAATWAQSWAQSFTPVAAHASNSAQWIRETVRLIEANRAAYEARELQACNLPDIGPSDRFGDNGHPIYLQVKEGVPTAREPKWPSVPRMAIPRVGETEITPGTLRRQKAEVESR